MSGRCNAGCIYSVFRNDRRRGRTRRSITTTTTTEPKQPDPQMSGLDPHARASVRRFVGDPNKLVDLARDRREHGKQATW